MPSGPVRPPPEGRHWPSPPSSRWGCSPNRRPAVPAGGDQPEFARSAPAGSSDEQRTRHRRPPELLQPRARSRPQPSTATRPRRGRRGRGEHWGDAGGAARSPWVSRRQRARRSAAARPRPGHRLLPSLRAGGSAWPSRRVPGKYFPPTSGVGRGRPPPLCAKGVLQAKSGPSAHGIGSLYPGVLAVRSGARTSSAFHQFAFGQPAPLRTGFCDEHREGIAGAVPGVQGPTARSMSLVARSALPAVAVGLWRRQPVPCGTFGIAELPWDVIRERAF